MQAYLKHAKLESEGKERMAEINKWMRNFINADKTGNPGNCPICNSPDTDYVIVQNPAFIEVWCNSCSKMSNMSYRGTPHADRKVMTGDEYANWKRKLELDLEKGRTMYADLTYNQRCEIENKVRKAGYLVLEEGKPANTTMCAEVVCPLCSNPLEVFTSGRSYQISCNTHGRIIVVRAYATPMFE